MKLHASNPTTDINGIPTYATEDPKTRFHHQSAAEIIGEHGIPNTLLSGSTKILKSSNVGYLARVLYMTPGLFCPSSTEACRKGCLGHTSGHMHMPGPTRARDQRAAFYIQYQDQFIEQLRDEIARHVAAVGQTEYQPTIRLNGTSDISWERVHPEVMHEFPHLQFYDYTKVKPRMSSFLKGRLGSKTLWPENYHLTYSGSANDPNTAKAILARGGTVALVFWPELPQHWWGYPVLDGDTHDARFLDPKGHIVGLKAKGIARVDLAGFVARPCPECQNQELTVDRVSETKHLLIVHRCPQCSFETRSKWILPEYLKQTTCSQPNKPATSFQLRLST